MKRIRKIIYSFPIIFIVLISSIAFADAPAKAPVGYDSLSQTEKQAADQELAQVQSEWDDFTNTLINKAKQDKNDCGNNYGGMCGFDNAYFLAQAAGELQGQFNSTIGSKISDLFNTYGVYVHVPKSKNYWVVKGVAVFSPANIGCDETQEATDINYDKCPGYVMTVKYWNAGTFDQSINIQKISNLLVSHPPGPSVRNPGTTVTVASPGLFTQDEYYDYGNCDVMSAKSKMSSSFGSPKVYSSGSSGGSGTYQPVTTWDQVNDKIGNQLTNTFKGFVDDINGQLFGANCDKDSLSVVSQFLNISRPLNITDNQYVIKLVNITQQIAFTMTIVIIAFYSFMYTTGYQNMDPVKFGIRLFLCLIAVDYLPWLMQDILNLNNVIVYHVSTLQFTFSNSVQGNTTDILMGSFSALFTNLSSGNMVSTLLLVILIIIMAILALAPMLKIIMWWYVRLLNLFLAAIVGPILMMLAALPQTADTAKKWVTKFIGSTFEQVFMALALVLVAIIIGNIGDFGKTIGVGWFGKVVLVYSAIYFLSDVPSFADKFLGGFGGKDYSKGFGKAAKNTYNRTKSFATGAVLGAGATALALSGKSAKNFATKQGIGGYVGRKIMNSNAGKLGSAIGHSTRGGYYGAKGHLTNLGKAGVGAVQQGAKSFGAGYGVGKAGAGMIAGAGTMAGLGSIAGAGSVVAGMATAQGLKRAGQAMNRAKQNVQNRMDQGMKNMYADTGNIASDVASDFLKKTPGGWDEKGGIQTEWSNGQGSHTTNVSSNSKPSSSGGNGNRTRSNRPIGGGSGSSSGNGTVTSSNPIAYGSPNISGNNHNTNQPKNSESEIIDSNNKKNLSDKFKNNKGPDLDGEFEDIDE